MVSGSQGITADCGASARLAFALPGPPQPKQRARAGKGGRWYTPKATQRYESAVRTAAMVAKHMGRLDGSAPAWPKDARYRVTVTAYFGDERRRDADNVGKAVLDACNGMLWHDDSQVRSLTVEREIDRATPRTEITVEVVP